MRGIMNLFDRSKKLNQTPFTRFPNYLPPHKQYKIIHQGLMIPNLPAPLHYFNFLSMIGQPNVPMLINKKAVIEHQPLNTATVISSISAHMVGHHHSYDIQKQCSLKQGDFNFDNREHLYGEFPTFYFERNDAELNVQLKIENTTLISHFTHLVLPLFEHWSILCRCEGQIKYKGQRFNINELGSFEYARAIQPIYLPFAFFTYQIINLDQHKQLLLSQIRNTFNQITQSRIYLRDLEQNRAILFDEKVIFKVKRNYPVIHTPDAKAVYLPREFEWVYGDEDHLISVKGRSRGDFKFGLAAGFVGSFEYEVQFNDEVYIGKSGYCEYIDIRPLGWQEVDNEQKCEKHGLKIEEIYLNKRK